MVDFAKSKFYWSGKQNDGASMQTHVDMAKKNCFAAQVLEEQTFDDVPPEAFCPVELEYVWSWFQELDATRQSGMSIGPITHVEITAWSQGMNLRLSPFEREAIRAIDLTFLIHSHSKDTK